MLASQHCDERLARTLQPVLNAPLPQTLAGLPVEVPRWVWNADPELVWQVLQLGESLNWHAIRNAPRSWCRSGRWPT